MPLTESCVLKRALSPPLLLVGSVVMASISASATFTTLASERAADSYNYPGSVETLDQVGIVARTQGVIAKRDKESNQC